MRITNPLSWFQPRGKAAETSTSSGIGSAQREQLAMGPWTGVMGGFVARQVNPVLFEALREAVPLLDAGICVTVALDGVVRVEGDNAELVAEIKDWMQSVRVNDAEIGFQAFYASQGAEMLEQGFGIGEWTARKDGKGIDRLRVADSKGVLFLRNGDTLQTYYRAPRATSNAGPTGLDTVEAVLRGKTGISAATALEQDYVLLDPRRVIYAVNQPEADNPYGTSKLRSLEFVAQVLLRIDNAIGRAWTRFGDPTWHLQYKTKNGKITSTELETRRKVLAQELSLALTSKESGNSSDLVTATGTLDEIIVTAIGAAQVAMDPTAPLKHITEQICAKFELPPWLLGVDGTVGAGQAERQAEMVLQSSKTRWERRKPGLEALVGTHLRLAGKTWKRGDWALVQELPNLQDMMKIAQAEFLHAQAAMVGGTGEAPRGVDNNLRGARSPRGKRTGSVHTKAPPVVRKESWAEDEENLNRIEKGKVRQAMIRWWALGKEVATVVGFEFGDREFIAPGEFVENWVFPTGALEKLLSLGSRFTAENSGEDAPVLSAAWDAWVRGTLNAADEGFTVGLTSDYEALVRAAMNQRLSSQVYTTNTRAYMEKFVGEFSSGAYDGMTPTTIAQLMTRKFGAGEYDWQRLITNEMAIAHASAKKAVYGANKIEKYNWSTSVQPCEFCIEMEANGPYLVSDLNSPTPGQDSHPGCKCSVNPILGEQEI